MLTTIIIVMTYLFLQMTVIWILYKYYNNPSIVDTSWSIGLMMSGLIYLFSNGITHRKALVAFLLVVWALRLAGHLWWTRLRLGQVDKRYTAISQHWKINQSLGFFLNFQLQALLIFIISFMFVFISLSPQATLTAFDYAASVIITLGIVGESIADIQLNRFKKNNKGKVCNDGLWYYSRHPNYFFDWITWSGFTLIAVQSTLGCFSLISLMLLYFIFTRVTGPITEKVSIQSKGQAYLDYMADTSMFMPWFK